MGWTFCDGEKNGRCCSKISNFCTYNRNSFAPFCCLLQTTELIPVNNYIWHNISIGRMDRALDVHISALFFYDHPMWYALGCSFASLYKENRRRRKYGRRTSLWTIWLDQFQINPSLMFLIALQTLSKVYFVNYVSW